MRAFSVKRPSHMFKNYDIIYATKNSQKITIKNAHQGHKSKKRRKNHIPKHNYPEHCRHIRQISPNWCCHKNRIHHLLARARLPPSKASPKPGHHINVARFWADPPRSPKLHTRLPFGVQVVVFSWQDWADGTPCRAVLIKQAIKKEVVLFTTVSTIFHILLPITSLTTAAAAEDHPSRPAEKVGIRKISAIMPRIARLWPACPAGIGYQPGRGHTKMSLLYTGIAGATVWAGGVGRSVFFVRPWWRLLVWFESFFSRWFFRSLQ